MILFLLGMLLGGLCAGWLTYHLTLRACISQNENDEQFYREVNASLARIHKTVQRMSTTEEAEP